MSKPRGTTGRRRGHVRRPLSKAAGRLLLLLVWWLLICFDNVVVAENTATIEVAEMANNGNGNGKGNGNANGNGNGSKKDNPVVAPTAAIVTPASTPPPSPSQSPTTSPTQVTPSPSPSPTPSPSPIPSPFDASEATAWFAILTLLNDGDTQLRSFRGGGGDWDKFCDGSPALVTKSLTESVNDNCPAQWTNLSCTCLSELQDPQTSWEFHVTKRNSSEPPAQPVPLMTAGTIAVSSIGAFSDIPAQLTSLKIIGESSLPLDVEWDLKSEWNQDNALISVAESSMLTSVEIVNVSLSSVEITSTFLPSTLVSITFRNCNLTKLSSEFTATRHEHLQRLDLSGNQLSTFATEVIQADGSESASTIQELDLSNNKFTMIPSSLFLLRNLSALNLQGNPIANYSVTTTQFEQLLKLSAFEIDITNDATSSPRCTGEWKQVGTASLCVMPVESKMISTQVSKRNESNMLLATMGIFVVGVIVVGAVLLRKKRRQLKKSFTNANTREVPLLDTAELRLIIEDAILSNPVVMRQRIPYKDIVDEECVSLGGYGVVYSATYKKSKVAVKKLRAEFSKDAKRVESFVREICLMASLEHPRIVTFIGVAWDSVQTLSAVTEFMEYGDLRDVLQFHKENEPKLTWEASKAKIALHVAEALAYLHTSTPTVIHRDLKSKNVLLNADLDAKLSDFGISREWTIDDTHMTECIGTTFWIAPEVLLGTKYDDRADVFSFGVVLSEIDTDDYPYWDATACNGLSKTAILQLVASGAVRPKFSATCPPLMLALAERCLDGDPGKRPSSAEVVASLKNMLAVPGSLMPLSSSPFVG